MANTIDMTYCGRIYLEPIKKREIYINVGWGVKDSQIYPQYEQWLSPYVTEQKYNEWIEELKIVFANAPFSASAQYWAYLCCFVTAGWISCPCCYVWYKSRSFKREVNDAFAKVSTNGAVIQLNETGGPSGGNWTDSKGQALMMTMGKRGGVPGGPPLGFNIILTSPSEIQWPPSVQFALGASYPPPAGYALPPGGYMPPPPLPAEPPVVEEQPKTYGAY